MKRVVLVALLLASSVGSAQDYLSYKMVSTAQQPFRVYVDSRSSSPAGLQYTLMQNAVERAWNTWNAVQCAYPKVQSLGPTGATVINPSQSSDNFSVTPVWMLINDADAQQVFGNTSLVAAITLPRAYAGVLQTCDVFFNGPAFSWSLAPVTPTDAMDVETVALHEGGHCLGLGHYGLFADVVMEQVVEKGVSVRALSALDVQTLCTRYPLAGQSASPCFSDGGCGQVDLKCLSQPVTNGLTFNLCSRGCTVGTNAICDTPLACQASNAFTASGMNGACQLPGSAVTPVGRQCLSAAECGTSSGLCQTPAAASGGNFSWVDGYCTQPCVAGQASCPAGSTCSQLAVGPRCLQSCRVGLADCRINYACAPIDAAGISGICVPRCFSDQDCASPSTVTCRTCDGLCVARQSISGQIGDVCSTEASCGAGQLCGATSGSSSTKQCTQQCSRGCGICPTGSSCTPDARGELICLRDCTGPGTCPLGLRCADTTVGKGCQPACTGNTDCPVGQSCFQGDCYTPMGGDGGCTSLTCRPDSGTPIVVDSGTGGGGGTGAGGGAGGSGGSDAGGLLCVPGQSIFCVGPGACAGGQSCNAEGSGYDACACGTSGGTGGGSTQGPGCSCGTTEGTAEIIMLGLGLMSVFRRQRWPYMRRR